MTFPRRFVAALFAAALLFPALSAAEDRTLPVTVVAGPSFRELSSWKGLALGAIGDAEEALHPFLRCRFQVRDIVTWNPEVMSALLPDALVLGREAVKSEERGLVVVLLGPAPPRLLEDHGYAFLLRPALVVAVSGAQTLKPRGYLREQLSLFIQHELGHVFGLPHRPGRNLMNERPQSRDAGLDELSEDVLRATRGLHFDPDHPFAGSELESLRTIYLWWHKEGRMESSLLVNLGVAFNTEARWEEAEALLQAGLRRNRSSWVGRLALARTLLELGQPSKAADVLGAAPVPFPAEAAPRVEALRKRLGS